MYVTRKVPDILVAQGDNGPGHEDLPVTLAAFEGGCERKKRFPGSRLAGNRYQTDIVVHERIE